MCSLIPKMEIDKIREKGYNTNVHKIKGDKFNEQNKV